MDGPESLPTYNVLEKKEFVIYKPPPRTEEENNEAVEIINRLQNMGPFQMVNKELDADQSDASQDATYPELKRSMRSRNRRPDNRE